MMFDLEAQLREWKRSFTNTAAMRSADLEELEHHLRDSMTSLAALGLTPEEAFLVATHRVGAPALVAGEFAKVDGSTRWYQQASWMTAGALGYALLGLVIGAMASLSQVVTLLAGGKGVAVGYTAVAITCIGWSVVAGWLYRRQSDGGRRLMNVSAGVLAALVACAAIAGSLVNFGGQMVLGRLMPVRELVWVQTISNVAGIIATVLAPLLLLLLVQTFRRQTRDTRALG